MATPEQKLTPIRITPETKNGWTKKILTALLLSLTPVQTTDAEAKLTPQQVDFLKQNPDSESLLRNAIRFNQGAQFRKLQSGLRNYDHMSEILLDKTTESEIFKSNKEDFLKDLKPEEISAQLFQLLELGTENISFDDFADICKIFSQNLKSLNEFLSNYDGAHQLARDAQEKLFDPNNIQIDEIDKFEKLLSGVTDFFPTDVSMVNTGLKMRVDSKYQIGDKSIVINDKILKALIFYSNFIEDKN